MKGHLNKNQQSGLKQVWAISCVIIYWLEISDQN